MSIDTEYMRPCDRLRWAREQAGFESARQFALRHNVGYSTYASHENGDRGIPISRARDYSRILRVTLEWLLTGKGSPKPTFSKDIIPVSITGYVQAGDWRSNLENDAREEFPSPIQLPRFMVEPYTEVEAVKVVGDSMNEIYADGAILFVTPAIPYVARGGEIASGLDVIVHQVKEDQLVESTVKRLEIINGEYWLVPKSTNPIYQSFQISSPDRWTDFDQDQTGHSFVSGVVLCLVWFCVRCKKGRSLNYPKFIIKFYYPVTCINFLCLLFYLFPQ